VTDVGATRPPPPSPPPRVFISYAHASEEHAEAVRSLWLLLRANGIDARLDRVAALERQDWSLWMADEIREADHVLVIASDAYRRRATGAATAHDGRGVQWEARLVRDAFYNNQHALSRFLPVVLPGQSVDGVPDFLGPHICTVYTVTDFTVAGAEPLLRLLTRQPEETEPPLGTPPVLRARAHVPEASSGRRDRTTGPDLSDRLDLSSYPLPGRRAHVVGRAAMIDSVRDALSESAADRPVVLCGLPGSGKTTVALEVVHDERIRRSFPGGILWATAGKDGQGVARSVLAWGRALGVAATELPRDLHLKRSLTLHNAIGNRAVLVVVDDVWSSEHTHPFLLGGENCGYLVTTRSPAVAAELTIPSFQLQTAELADVDARALLHQESGLGSADGIDTLVPVTGGLPLALVIAARYLRRRAIGGNPIRLRAAVDSLRNRSQRLRLEWQGSDFEDRDIPRTLFAMVAMTAETLSPAARNLLGAIARFPPKPNSVSLEAAAAAAGEDAVYELCDAGLLESLGPATLRYALHQSVADFALETEFDRTYERRMLQFYVTQTLAPEGSGDMTPLDLDNQLAALDVAFQDGGDVEYVEGVVALAPAIREYLPYVRALRYLNRALQVARQQELHKAVATLLLHLAAMANVTEGAWSAADYAREGLRVAEDEGLREERIDLMLCLSDAYHFQGDVPQARRILAEAYELAVLLRDRNRTGQAAYRMAGAAHTNGEEREAESRGLEALRISEETGDLALRGQVLHILGWIHYVLGNHGRATQEFEEQRRIALQLDSTRSLISAADGVGWCRFVRGDLMASRAAYEEGLGETRKVDEFHAPPLFSNLGVVLTELGEFPAAESAFDEAIARANRLRQQQVFCLAWFHSGELASVRGDQDLALQRLGRALDVAENNGYSGFVPLIRRARAEAFALSGDLDRARREIDAVRRAETEANPSYDAVRALRVDALVRSLEDEPEAARAALLESLNSAESAGFTVEAALTRMSLAELEADDDRDQAAELCRAAHAALVRSSHRCAADAERLLTRLTTSM
jgi:tetratricopeptide (TPR) repeat protein